MKRYNLNLMPEEQITWEVPEMELVPQTTDIGVTETNYFSFWTAGEFGDSQRNAEGHFRKHIMTQREFSGRYGNVVDYTRGALEFARRTDVIEDMQPRGNWGKYSFDVTSGTGEMVVLNGENGKLASYYELRGSIEEVSRYIREKLKASSWMEVREKLVQASSRFVPLVPMVTTQTVSSPIPIPTRTNRHEVDRFAVTPPHTPPDGWADTPPGSPRGTKFS